MVTLVTYNKITFVYQGFCVSETVVFPCCRNFVVSLAFDTVTIYNCHISTLLSSPFGIASNPLCIPYGPFLRFDLFRLQPLIPDKIPLISLLSDFFMYFGSPAKHSAHTSTAQTFSLFTSLTSDPRRFPLQN